MELILGRGWDDFLRRVTGKCTVYQFCLGERGSSVY